MGRNESGDAMSESQNPAIPPATTAEPAQNGETVGWSPRAEKMASTGNEADGKAARVWEARVRQAIEEAKQPLPEEMTLSQAMDFLGVSQLRLYKLIKRGELSCRKVGKRRRIPTAALLELREKMF